MPLILTVIGAPVLGEPLSAGVTSVDYSTNDVRLLYRFPRYGSTANIKQMRIDTCISDCSKDSNWSRVVNLTTHNHSSGGTYVHKGGAAEPYRQYRIYAYNGYDWPSLQSALPPTTVRARVVSKPASGNTFRYGEHVDVEVEFNQDMRVVGTPDVALGLGEVGAFTHTLASYNRGSGTNRIVFRRTVQRTDLDLSGFQFASRPIRVDSDNRIVQADGGSFQVRLGLRDWLWLSNYKIDGRNRAPVFASDTLSMSLTETIGSATEAAARNVGAPVTATDPDSGDSLTYSLEGTDASAFGIDADSGQIGTKKGGSYDHEAKASHSVTVKATDGSDSTDTVAVTITVTDEDEPPLAPAAPSVSPTFGNRTSLDIGWTAPANVGRPAVTHYDLQYRAGTSGSWSDGPQTVTGTGAKIAGLAADTGYQVRVRAVNAEGDGAWSQPGSGRTWPLPMPATGAPAIAGAWQVGRILTASRGTIADPNGVPPESDFSWQWLRVDNGSDTAISGATGKTYVVTGADVGKRIKVTARFTDGIGTRESRTSLPYPAEGSVESAACAAPSLGDRRQLWSGTLTAGVLASRPLEHGYAKGVAGSLSDKDFSFGASRHEVVRLSTQRTDSATQPIDLRLALNRALTAAQKAALRLHVCNRTALALSGSSLASSRSEFRLRGYPSLWFDEFEATLRLSLPANTAATGAPGLSGASTFVGDTLTASLGDIADADGVPAESSFAWQWLRVDGTTETAIAGAVGSTYTLAAADFGKKVRVRASFTDGLGARESRESAASSTVGYRVPVVTVAAGTSPVTEGTDATFTFSRSGDTARALGVRVNVSASGGDMAAPAGLGTKTLSFGAGKSTASLAVATVDDKADEEDGVVTASILADTAAKATYLPGLPKTASVTVSDDEADSTNKLRILRLGNNFGNLCAGIEDRPLENVEGTICLGVLFNGISPAGFTASDLKIEKGTLDDFRFAGSNSNVQRITVDVTGSAGEELVFRIPRGSLDAGNAEAVWRATITSSSNRAPIFSGPSRLRMAETVGAAKPPARHVGAPVTATDRDGDTLSYSIDGSAFTIDSETGQVSTVKGRRYDHEQTREHSVTIRVSDGSGGSGSTRAVVEITDVDEPPLAPAAPAVSRTANSLTSLDARWSEPDNTGRPAIQHYDIQYRGGASGPWSDGPQNVQGTSATIANLTSGRFYQVRVRATNAEGDSPWSSPAGGTTGNTAPTGANKTVTVNEDATYTVAASDFGFSDTDSGDTLSSVKITALPASGRGVLSLNGTAIASTALPKTVTKAELDANKLKYTPPADANGTGYASFSFKVNDGTADSTSAYTITVNVTAVNDTATGLPTISGTARVGQTLTASVSGIADAKDGLTRAANGDTGYAFAYQWLRVSNGTDTAISGATGSTYRLVSADQGKKLKVRVSFKDDDGHAETLTSAATGTVGANAAPTGANKTVTMNEDATYTVAASDFGFSDTDSGDTLSSVKITALPALGKGVLSLDGTAIASTALPKTVTKAELDANKLKYTPPADANGTGYASFSFKVNDGTADSASAYTITVNVTAVNDTATGLPTISGTARVGQTLTASVSGIADAKDGLTKAANGDTGYAFAYQWLRVSNGTDTAISGATSKTYRLVSADGGKKFKVRVSFKDDDGHAETLTSALYPATDAQVLPNTAPTGANKTVTMNEDATYIVAASDFRFSDTDSGDALASVKVTALPASGKGVLSLDGTAIASTALPKTVTKAELDADKLKYTPPADANGTGYASFSFKVNDGTADSATAYTITVDVTAVNDTATGLPTVSGTARVGQTLTASASGIADAKDGLTRAANGDTGYAFAYQWLRVSNGTDTAISGATGSTYRLVSADQGKKLKMRVSFKDDDGHAETLTSAATGTVGANAAPTGANKTVTMNEDATYTVAASDFRFSDTDSGDTLSSVKITALPASGKGVLSLDGTAIASTALPKTVTKAELDADKLKYTPPADANGSGYAGFSFKVNDGTADSASAYTITVNVTAVNDPATGLPTVSGTARVGQTLTASVSGIADAKDGLTRAANGDTGYAFAYQWLRVSNGTDTAISGATGSTYRLVSADQGKKLKMRVSFKDDDGHAETLTSAATGTVGANAAPTGAAKTVTIVEDTTWTASASDFGFSDTDSGDTLSSVKITALPASGRGVLSLNGTAIASTALPKTVTKAELDGDKLVYTPPADANGTGYATFSFKVNDGTADSASAYTITVNVTAVNDTATGLPTVSGTARVGQTLTASVSGIADAKDGLTKAANGDTGYAFAYQWLRVSNGTDTAISGATSKTYRLVSADGGKKFKVRVSFKDDDGHAETLTSALYPATDAQVLPNTAPTGANKTVTMNEDATYIVAASDFRFSDTDSGDALASVKVTALPASGKGVLSLDGTAIASTALPKTVTKAELDADKLKYTPPADANGTGYASFSFKVNDGTADSATAYTITVDVTAVNDTATGLPTVSGTARVGQTLTASASGIADAKDGLTRAANGDTGYAFAYQWLRVSNGTDTAISGATGSTYRLVSADQGKKLKMRVSFKDDDGHAETLTSAATGTVGANAAPTGANKTVTMNEDATYTVAASDFRFSDTDSGDTLSSVKITALPASGKGVLSLDGTAIASTALPKTVTKAELDADKLKYTPPADANGSGYAGFSFKVNDGTADSASAYTITVNVTAVNDTATGLPTVSGTARVGQTLTASVSGIADAKDGLTRAANGDTGYAFAYQWLRVSNGTDTAISGATGSTYRLVSADQGKKLKMRVSFKDDDGHAETLTSAATGTVGANAAPTGANKTVTVSEDATWTASAADFGFSDTDSGDALVSVKVTALPALGKGVLSLDGTAIASTALPKTVTKAELDGDKLVYTPPADANGTGYATFSFKVNDGTADSASAYTITVNVTAVNDPATGLPTISGMARVGQTLTASVSGIADAKDGLTRAANGDTGYAFAYQWLRVSNGTDTAISGATGSTYRLVSADQGKKLKMRVSFKDDDGHAETLTSAASGTVAANAAPTGAAKTVTIVEDTTWTASDFGFSDTDSGDTLSSVKITALPASGKGVLSLNGTAIASTALPKTVTKAELDGDKLVYTPPADANGTGYASFSFKVNDGTADSTSAYTITVNVTAVNDPATGLPTISGTARVGQTLTASVSGIADAKDGLTRAANGDTGYAFAYQWLRVSNGTDTAISGATSKTYRLVSADGGKKFKVRVSFKDDDGHAETLTSAASGTVGANAAPTGAAKTVTIVEDTTWTASASDFGFSDTDSGDTLSSVKITALPASGKGVLSLDGTAIASTALPKTVTKAELDGDKLVYTPPADANGTGYASFSFKVNDGTADSATAYTITVNVTAVNDPATGLPTVSGTARVGEVLTASASGIADAKDGLTRAANGDTGYAFAYQWLRVSNGTDTAISGATSKTYRLVSADGGKKFKVRVSFKDDDGHAETLTSAASGTVGANAAPTGAAKTVTIVEDTTWTASASDFGFSDTDSGDTLSSVKITALPASGKGVLSLDGTAIASTALPKTVTKAELDGDKLVYTPPADANGTGYATFSFKVNDGTADSASAYTITVNVTAVNDPATGLPTVSGTARVGEVLTASASGIADAKDGLTRAANGDTGYAFAYQWLRVTGTGDTATEAAIPGATSQTYRLVSADEGKKFKVRVSFKDDDGHAETLTSAAYPSTNEAASPTLSVADAEVEEAADVTLDFAVTLSRPLDEAVTVAWVTSDGTAAAGSDYTAGSGTLIFAAGETEKTVQVAVLDDGHHEDSETMTLTLSNPSPARVKLADAEATGTIRNLDATPKAWIVRFGRTAVEQFLDAMKARMEAARTPGVEVLLAGERINWRRGAERRAGQRPDKEDGSGAKDGGASTVPAGAGNAGDGAGAPGRRGVVARETGTGPGQDSEKWGRVLAAEPGQAHEQGAWRAGLGEWPRDATYRTAADPRTLSDRDFLFGSSFNVTTGSGGPGSGGGTVSIWGRGAVSSFDGREGELTVDGEVASAMLGADWSRDRTLAGLIAGYSTAKGGYRVPAGGGTVTSTLTGLYPWGRYSPNDRLDVWGAAGYGEGTLTLKPAGQDAIRTDLDLWMAATGLRGVLVDGGSDGFTLAATTDAMEVQTSTDAVPELAASNDGVTRLRLGLESARPILLGDGSVLTLGMEIGVRHDGGDAETGFGADIGGGLAWSDPKRGINAEISGRGLLAHEANGFRERGFSGSLGWDPVKGDRGPSLSLTQTFGGASSGGADALLRRDTLEGLAANEDGEGSGDLRARRLEARFGYGIAAFDGGFTVIPEAGIGLSNTGRDYRLGWRLVRVERGAGNPGSSLELSIEATRHESAASDSDSPEHSVGMRLVSRF